MRFSEDIRLGARHIMPQGFYGLASILAMIVILYELSLEILALYASSHSNAYNRASRIRCTMRKIHLLVCVCSVKVCSQYINSVDILA